MEEKILEIIKNELQAELKGRLFGRAFQISKFQFAVDFRLPDGRFLFIAMEPNAPRIYLIRRRLKDIERMAAHSGSFALVLRKHLSNAQVLAIEKLSGERIIHFALARRNELGEIEKYSLICQLTGRSSGLFLLDQQDRIIDSLRGEGIGSKYEPPASRQFVGGISRARKGIPGFDAKNPSESIDLYYLETERSLQFSQRAKAAESKLRQEISKKEKLLKKLDGDLALHGEPEKWKNLGDLLLANISGAARIGEKVLLVDYFAEDTPVVELNIEENLSLSDAASKYFSKYTKARNGLIEIARRKETAAIELKELLEKEARLHRAIEENDDSFFPEAEKAKTRPAKKRLETGAFKGARKYLSSDGFEILVGKGSKDNDYLTFKVAKSLDLWLHAADYAGSHVVVRNPNRSEVPPKTLIEAARLAAYFSQGKMQPKAAVHYTAKKFINKPKGAAPGLVSLASFKTILVEPGECLEKI